MTAYESASPSVDLWAGVECTLNRVGDNYFDQLERSGHAVRIEDLDRLAALGVSALRFPVLWERIAPVTLDQRDWSWTDERLTYLQTLCVRPITGLVHHGSGPRYTNLLDPRFPEKLAEFAGAVAQRYPWLEDYTPVNEPLTTARFSCLYGFWYPHERDALKFARAFLNQARAIVLSMRAVRNVNSEARLIQTEDLGKTFSTSTLAYQAEFENERRWLTFDLLCGRVHRHSPMWDYFTWLGIPEPDLAWFLENPCPPDIAGINHYVTSERFLDDRINRYPMTSHGGNGRHVYADVEAVRVCAEGVAGPKAIMKEFWERYELPFAITEAHLGCTREEQLRWFNEVWTAAKELRAENVDVRAVTAWSAFGAFDWNTLLTASNGSYEPGIFDVRSPSPRPTALGRMLKAIAAGEAYDHPSLDAPGWWHRFDRLCYPAVTRRIEDVATSVRRVNRQGSSSRALLISGATGTLGTAFARLCEKRGLAYYLLSRDEMDIAEPASVAAALNRYEPWGVVNAAGFVRVDEAEHEVERCMRENATGPETLARSCVEKGISFVTFSSDLVFDGEKTEPYLESDPTAPLNIYGKSKADAEARVLFSYPDALVVRTSAFFGPWDDFNFADSVLRSVANGDQFYAADDITISPTYVPDLVNATLDLLIDEERGIWHLANPGQVTWAEFARRIAQHGGYDERLICPCSNESLKLAAKRPHFGALASERGKLLRSFEHALDCYFDERKPLGGKTSTMRIGNG